MPENIGNSSKSVDDLSHAEAPARQEGFSSLYTKEKLELHGRFFDRLINDLSLEKQDADIIAVLHILPDAIPFTQALSKVANINSIIPKPKSINKSAIERLDYSKILHIDRKDTESIMGKVREQTVFLDIGGYFSGIANELGEKIGDKFCGIVEDTENGLQKYEKLGLNFPFISVARSPLKENEDTMVGQAIAYSAEGLLRQHSVLVNGLSVGIIGFGKIGRSVAHNMRQKQGTVSVHDVDNIRLTHAVSSGFEAFNKEKILAESDVICLATGNISLSSDEYSKLKNGCWVFSVTSSDDELDKQWLEQNYTKEQISRYATMYSNGPHHFYLLNEGNAINFIHGTTVGDFILLVHAELLVAAHKLLTKQQPIDQHELDKETRDKICKTWLSIFKNMG